MRFLGFGLLAVWMGLVHAGDEPAYLSLDWSSDKDGNHENYLDLDLPLPGLARFYLTTSRAFNDDEIISLETRSVLVGVGSDPLESFSAGGEVAHWGNEDFVETDTVRFSFSFNQPSWSLMLRPQWRRIYLYTDPTFPCPLCPSKLDFTSVGLAVDGRYFTDGPWSVSLGFTRHDYDWDVTRLDKYPEAAINWFSFSTLDLAYGLQDYRSSLGVYYDDFDSVSFSFNHTKSVSKVDGLATYVNTFGLSGDILKNLSGRISLGSQRTGDGDPHGFIGTGLTFSW